MHAACRQAWQKQLWVQASAAVAQKSRGLPNVFMLTGSVHIQGSCRAAGYQLLAVLVHTTRQATCNVISTRLRLFDLRAFGTSATDFRRLTGRQAAYRCCLGLRQAQLQRQGSPNACMQSDPCYNLQQPAPTCFHTAAALQPSASLPHCWISHCPCCTSSAHAVCKHHCSAGTAHVWRHSGNRRRRHRLCTMGRGLGCSATCTWHANWICLGGIHAPNW